MPDPLTINVPEPVKCYMPPLATSGQYDGTGLASSGATWTVKVILDIPDMIPGFPALFHGEIEAVTNSSSISGLWTASFALTAAQCGPNATLRVELWASTDTTNPVATKTVANFNVMAACPVQGNDINPIIIGTLRTALATARRQEAQAAGAAATTPPLYHLFTGTTPAGVLPAVVRIECVVQREYFAPTPPIVISGGRAEFLPSGRWGVPLFVPDPADDTQDWLYVTWYTIGGVAVHRDRRKIQ